MIILVTIVSLFVIGSVIGWLIELFFRRIFTAKKWINPGFLVGPYLPLYGFGVLMLYGLSNINLVPFGLPIVWDYVIKILFIGLAMTLVELIAGLIFVKGMKIKLWDYSARWGNFKGLICPLFSFLWTLVGALYLFFVNPFLVDGLKWLSENQIYSFFVGIVLGCMIVDTCYSLHLATRITKAAKASKIIITYDKLKESMRQFAGSIKEKRPNFIFSFKSNKTMIQNVDEYKQSKFFKNNKDNLIKDKKAKE